MTKQGFADLIRLEHAALEYAGFPKGATIDSEERYYQKHKCELYDAFIAGSKFK